MFRKKYKRPKHSRTKLVRDLLLVCLSVVIAIFILRIGVLQDILTANQEYSYVSSFVAGLFFTSAFTIAPAAVALAKISLTTPTLSVAFWGALGAMVGDLILFLFIRDSLAEDILDLINRPVYKRLKSVFKLRIFRWLVPLMGALMIASPLPDEIGLAMMGFSRVSIAVMIPVTFAMNFIGVIIICIAAVML